MTTVMRRGHRHDGSDTGGARAGHVLTATEPTATEPTTTERADLGRQARASVPRSSHAVWQPSAGRADPIDILEAQAASRVPDLIPIRYGRMLSSPFAFYRGAAAIMAADLPATPNSGIYAQLCGDAHLANFGGFASAERDLVFDINDFDETYPGPWEWDLKRLATSFVVAGRQRGYDDVERRDIVVGLVRQYREAMRAFAAIGAMAVWYSVMDMPGLLARWRNEARAKDIKTFKRTVEKARTKDRIGAFQRLTHVVNGERRIISDPPLIVPIEQMLPDAERADVEASIRQILDHYRRTLASERRHLLKQYRLVHVAQKVVGVGSVGTEAWIALLLGDRDDDPLFLQFKEAQASVLAPFVSRVRYSNQGERVVAGQRLIQATGDILLGWTKARSAAGHERDFYVRQLWDWKMSADIDNNSLQAVRIFAKACGWTLARAHARSGDRIAIAAYLGGKDVFDNAIADFAETYADQNERDYAAVREAATAGRIAVREGI